MYLYNGKKIDINRNFTGPDSTQYPHLKPPEWRNALGVVEAPDPTYPDPLTHSYIENPDGSLTVTERPLADVKAEVIRRINADCSTRIYVKYSREVQQSAALGIYPALVVDQMRSEIAAMIAASNGACDLVNATTTVITAANSGTVTWPI